MRLKRLNVRPELRVSSECINVIAVYLFEQMCIINVRLGELKIENIVSRMRISCWNN